MFHVSPQSHSYSFGVSEKIKNVQTESFMGLDLSPRLPRDLAEASSGHETFLPESVRVFMGGELEGSVVFYCRQ